MVRVCGLCFGAGSEYTFTLPACRSGPPWVLDDTETTGPHVSRQTQQRLLTEMSERTFPHAMMI